MIKRLKLVVSKRFVCVNLIFLQVLQMVYPPEKRITCVLINQESIFAGRVSRFLHKVEDVIHHPAASRHG